MPRKPKKTISDRLTGAQVAITNTLEDTEIQSSVAQFGYDATKLNEGNALCNTAAAAVSARLSASGAQKQSTNDLKKAEKEGMDAFQALAKVAKAVFKNDKGMLEKLGLNKGMPRTTAGFILAGYALFDNAAKDEGIKSKLAQYGYDDAKLQTERGKISAFESANNAQEAAKGTKQQATHDQEAAMKKLDDWVAQYMKIAKVALRGKKNLLEKLGVTVRSTKTAAQRKAPTKAAATRAAKKATGSK